MQASTSQGTGSKSGPGEASRLRGLFRDELSNLIVEENCNGEKEDHEHSAEKPQGVRRDASRLELADDLARAASEECGSAHEQEVDDAR